MQGAAPVGLVTLHFQCFHSAGHGVCLPERTSLQARRPCRKGLAPGLSWASCLSGFSVTGVPLGSVSPPR